MGKVIKSKNTQDRDDILVKLDDGRTISLHADIQKESCDCYKKIHDCHIKNIRIEDASIVKDAEDESAGQALNRDEIEQIEEELITTLEIHFY